MHRTIVALIACGACGGSPQKLTRATSSVYVRSDTDRTTVITPQLAVAANVTTSTNVEVGYEVDAWTGASVDVVTAATRAISERRNELDVGISHQAGRARFSGGYRFSIEPDYRSHGLVLGGRLELANKNTTLGLDLIASSDSVGRAGDPFFERSLRSAGARLSIAQVLDRASIVELVWESTRLDGFQASPYRWVAIGGDGTCASAAPFCIPEHVPDERFRHTLFARGRRALARHWSAGGEYRFYFDDWGIQSHAVQADVAWRVTPASMLSLRYRYYTQDEATFYRPRYFDLMSSGGYFARDRKLSAFLSHELGTTYLHRFELRDGDLALVGGLRAGGAWIDYLAFVGLDHVWVAELTALLGVELP
ncbi:MAG: DUF3570 domain-containing protein [Kofleriaceae bacterium]|nr:DUF3570 domain-containing protein [Kofleriaceae bacterium]